MTCYDFIRASYDITSHGVIMISHGVIMDSHGIIMAHHDVKMASQDVIIPPTNDAVMTYYHNITAYHTYKNGIIITPMML